MKKVFVPGCIVVLLLVLYPAMMSAQSAVQRQIDTLMKTWEKALVTEDLDTLIDCYWPDALSVTYNRNGESAMQDGSRAIRREQEGWFDQLDYPSLGLKYPEPQRFLPEQSDKPVYIYDYSSSGFMDIFYFEKRSGEYRISKHVLLIIP